MDSFSYPDLCNCLTKKKISCGSVGPNSKECHSALLAACFMLVPCFTDPSVMMMETVHPSEMIDFKDHTALHPSRYNLVVCAY